METKTKTLNISYSQSATNISYEIEVPLEVSDVELDRIKMKELKKIREDYEGSANFYLEEIWDEEAEDYV